MGRVWNVTSLKEHLEALLAREVECVDEKREADRRLHDDLHRDVSRLHEVLPMFLTRSDYEPRHSQLQEAIASIRSRVDQMEATLAGQSSGEQAARTAADRAVERNRNLVFGVLGLVVSLALVGASLLVVLH